MDISEYFRSNTRELLYTPNSIDSISIKQNIISIHHHTLDDTLEKGVSTIEEKKAFFDELFSLGPRKLVDNKVLIQTLKTIEHMTESEEWSFNSPELIRLLPSNPQCVTISVGDFCDELIALYLLFIAYRVLIWEEENIPKHWITALKRTQLLLAGPFNTLADRCREHIHMMNLMVQDSQVHTTFYFDDDLKLRDRIEVDSLYNALVHQLMLHIAAGSEGLENGRLATCERCLKAFVKIHGNQRFCKDCNHPNIRANECKARKRKKEAANAQEKHP